MNSSGPKYSIDDLPDDGWEVRRTKQVARAILAAKAERKVTTERLAKLCSRFLDEPDAVKTATLNGLFAGKRRSISVTELQMFSEALDISVLDLLYPVGQRIEIQPRTFVSSSEAVVASMRMTIDLGQASIYANTRADLIASIVRLARLVEQDAVAAIGAIRRFPGQSDSDWKLTQLVFRVRDYQTAISKLRALGEEPPQAPVAVSWAAEIDAESIDAEMLARLEPAFEGWSSGDYRLGGASDVEYPEAPER